MSRERLREKIQFYLMDWRTLPGKIIDIFIIFLNLLVCVIFAIETYEISEKTIKLLWDIELVTIVFFIIEYIARLYAARDRLKQFLNIYSMIDLIAILPTVTIYLIPVIGVNIGFIRIIRVFKVLRIFRFLRFLADEYFFFGSTQNAC